MPIFDGAFVNAQEAVF